MRNAKAIHRKLVKEKNKQEKKDHDYENASQQDQRGDDMEDKALMANNGYGLDVKQNQIDPKARRKQRR